MKKKSSLQTQILLIVISAILSISVLIGGISIYEVDRYVQETTEIMISASCEKEAALINDILNDLEATVNIMESFVVNRVSDGEALLDAEYREHLTETAEILFLDMAQHIKGSEHFYLRFAPELSTPTAGFYYSKSDETGQFQKLPNTDLSLYGPEDTEHVGWYWQPVAKGSLTWMMPYYNEKYDTDVITCCAPMYKDGVLLGVVGMDMDYSILTDKIDQIKVYKHDEAFLAKDNILVYHSDLAAGQIVPEPVGKYMWTYSKLDNGMDFCLMANYEDMWEVRYSIGLKIVGIVTFITLVFILIVTVIIRKTSRPIQRLIEAAAKLSAGSYDLQIEHGTTKELMQLSNAFETMARQLQEHDIQLHKSAYWDLMTGLRNATAYKEWVLDFSRKLAEKDEDFGICMLDLNYLKNVNDTYGHANGNKLIAAASKIIADTFKRSPVFRIGGDEFVVVLQNSDLEQHEELIAQLDEQCRSTYVEIGDRKIPICIARGVAIHSKDKGISIEDVFNHADEAMYEHKRWMKQQNVIWI